jgi:hypothetical protein
VSDSGLESGLNPQATPVDATPTAQPATEPPPTAAPFVPPPVPPYAAASVAAATPGGFPPQYPSQQYPTQTFPTAPYTGQSGYAPPQSYTPPQGYAPPQGYGPYTPQRQPSAPRRAPGLGLVAFFLSLAAAIVAPVIGSIAAYNIGSGIGAGISTSIERLNANLDPSVFTPVREWVLMGEVAFWVGTVLGIWALIQGIIAITKNRGRGWGVAAVVLTTLGPLLFFLAVQAWILGMTSVVPLGV